MQLFILFLQHVHCFLFLHQVLNGHDSLFLEHIYLELQTFDLVDHLNILLLDGLCNIVDVLQILAHFIQLHIGSLHNFTQLSPHGLDDVVHLPIHGLQILAIALFKKNE